MNSKYYTNIWLKSSFIADIIGNYLKTNPKEITAASVARRMRKNGYAVYSTIRTVNNHCELNCTRSYNESNKDVLYVFDHHGVRYVFSFRCYKVPTVWNSWTYELKIFTKTAN